MPIYTKQKLGRQQSLTTPEARPWRHPPRLIRRARGVRVVPGMPREYEPWPKRPPGPPPEVDAILVIRRPDRPGRPATQSIVVPRCPFCGAKHVHGAAVLGGPRLSHCGPDRYDRPGPEPGEYILRITSTVVDFPKKKGRRR